VTRVLVTGGTGFVGRHVLRALGERGYGVRALVRSEARAGEAAALGAEPVRGDVTDAASLRAAVAGSEVVVHLVSILVGRPTDFERIMARATSDLVAAAEEAGARRIVLMSALGTSTQTRDLVPYYRAKWAMEETVRASRLEHVILRPSFVFGADGGALPRFLRIARRAPVTPILGPGTQRLQPIWVEDLAAIVAAVVDEPAAAGRVLELGGPDVVSWNELWPQLQRAQGKRRPTVHVPFALIRPLARLLELLPEPPITRDQLAMLAAGDNVASAPDAADLLGRPLLPLAEQLRRAVG
jgi:NADH dehydrogenase